MIPKSFSCSTNSGLVNFNVKNEIHTVDIARTKTYIVEQHNAVYKSKSNELISCTCRQSRMPLNMMENAASGISGDFWLPVVN